MIVIGIDPGPAESAYAVCGGETIWQSEKLSNPDLLCILRDGAKLKSAQHLVIEMIACYGMAVGAETFETCVWIGRFMEAFGAYRTSRLPRLDVKMHLCHDSRAKDKNIRQALIDRFGGPAAIRKGGALYGISGDVWSALAVALAYWDTRNAK